MSDRARIVVCSGNDVARRRVHDAAVAGGLLVVGDVATVREGLELVAYYRPDAVLWGIDLLAASPQFDRWPEGIPVLALRDGTESDDAVLAALRAGATGVTGVEATSAELASAVAAAVAGEASVPNALIPQLLAEWRTPQVPNSTGLRPVRSPLTDREWEVLDLLCAGCSTTEIATIMDVSVETVRSHVKFVLRKLGVKSRAEAVEQAHQLRTMPPSG